MNPRKNSARQPAPVSAVQDSAATTMSLKMKISTASVTSTTASSRIAQGTMLVPMAGAAANLPPQLLSYAPNPSWASFGPISDDVYALTFGTKAECYRAVNSYVGKSGKTKGSGNNRKSGKGHGKSGKGYYKSGLSFVGEGFCRDSDNQNYDAVWFIFAGLLESSHDGKEPGLGLCEAKCKSPPSYNPDIEHVSY